MRKKEREKRSLEDLHLLHSSSLIQSFIYDRRFLGSFSYDRRFLRSFYRGCRLSSHLNPGPLSLSHQGIGLNGCLYRDLNYSYHRGWHLHNIPIGTTLINGLPFVHLTLDYFFIFFLLTLLRDA